MSGSCCLSGVLFLQLICVSACSFQCFFLRFNKSECRLALLLRCGISGSLLSSGALSVGTPCLLAVGARQHLVVQVLLLLGSCSVPTLSTILQQNLLSLIFGQSFLCRFLKLHLCTVLSDTLPDKYQPSEQISRPACRVLLGFPHSVLQSGQRLQAENDFLGIYLPSFPSEITALCWLQSNS